MKSRFAIVRYLARLFLTIDILCNVLLGGAVETMSSRMGKAIIAGKRCILCKLICGALSVFWPDHCIHNRMEPLE